MPGLPTEATGSEPPGNEPPGDAELRSDGAPDPSAPDAPSLAIEQRDGRTVFAFSGRLDAQGVASLWRRTLRAARDAANPVFDLSRVTFCDVAGAAFLTAAETASGKPAELRGADPKVATLLDRVREGAATDGTPPPAAATIGEIAESGLRAAGDGIAFLGEAAIALIRLPARHRMLRLPDFARLIDQAGVRALPLVMLLGYLMGLILAFQSSIPMRRFGADLLVANVVAISLLRELGPLLASVILAGRSGSAFAAEIGTMKVNEELDALTTMGLDPMTMLVLPRLVAAMLVMPALSLMLDLAGLAGMATVLTAFGFPLVAIGHQVQYATAPSYVYGGLFKAVIFGAAVAAIGCRAGLATGLGPRAVGQSATAAVVGGIVATITLDGVFALMFYRLGW
jgi:phospholipid/cholesterol/gamma-HCH transport system permease protein